MAASKYDITCWFQDGVVNGKTHMIIICDTYDYEDYPVYVPHDVIKYHDAFSQPLPEPELVETITDPRDHPENNDQNMRRVMECYDLRMDMNAQLAERRAHHWDL